VRARVVAGAVAVGLVVAGTAAVVREARKDVNVNEDEYVAALNALCEEYSRKHDAIGEPQSFADLVDKLPRIIEAFEPLVAGQRRIEAPHELADDAKRLTEIGERQLEVMRRLVAAARDNDLDALQPLVAENQALNGEATEISRRLGATACAGD
jgi:hypothetical protein